MESQKIILNHILACPKCKTNLPNKNIGKCRRCGFKYTKKNGIWSLFYSKGSNTIISQQKYHKMHTVEFGGPEDGSYEILAKFARGNKSVDIASGDGLIQRFSPETVAVEFSENALKKCKKNGAKHLVLADAQYLPFIDNSFDISICTGSLEHFDDPQLAINEMSRISRIQIIIAHKKLPFFGAKFIRKLVLKLMNKNDQPIDNPMSLKDVLNYVNKAGLKVVYQGIWTLPYTYALESPSCVFVISIKK